MDYERIQKLPQQQKQLSPGKLGSMLLRGEAEKKRIQGEVEEKELESTSLSLRSQASQIHDSGASCSENCKDLDVVSVHKERSTTKRMDSSVISGIIYDRKLKDHSLVSSRIRSTDDSSFDCDTGIDSISVSSSVFEFQKAERAPQRMPLAPFSKPAPSKWDNAQKWIASPTSNRPKNGQGNQDIGSRKPSHFGYGSRQSSAKVVTEVPDQSLVPYEEPDTKQIDFSHNKGNAVQKFVCWDSYSCASESYSRPVLMIENCIGESAINLSCHDSSLSIHSATTFIPPPSTARSVSMRDMGTEMTPIASQEPSRTGTPVRATTPTRSPTSRPSTPGRAAAASSPTDPPTDPLDPNRKELSDKEFQKKTRREIMFLGTQLGKMNIAAWAGKDDENKEASTLLETVAAEQPSKSVTETRAAAWEKAEKAKYMARFTREEMKIQAWENHQKAKTEAEMRKIEVEVERMRARAHDKLMNKLAAVQHKAEAERATAESKRNRHAAKTQRQTEYIRRTGRIPSSFSCCRWCF